MDEVAPIITALGAALAAVIGASAVLTRARSRHAKGRSLLREIWFWIEGKKYDAEVPPTLAQEIRDDIAGGDES